MSVGSLPRHEVRIVADLLAGHTDTPASCWFAVWDGYGQLHGSPAVARLVSGSERTEPVAGLAPPDVLSGPRLELPNRAYGLLHGAVAEAAGVFDLLGRQSPNLWWPNDRAWCVATEIDLGWSYIAGASAAIADVVASADIEALEARITDGITYESDRINTTLDHP
jgi:hypothetical protein